MAWGDNDPTAGQAKAKAGWGDSDPVAQPAPSKSQPKRTATQDITGFMANVNRGTGLGDELAAGADAAITLGKNFITGKQHLDASDPNGSLDKAWGDQFKASLAKQSGTEDSYAAAHPHAAALAQGTGNALTAIAPAGQTAELAAGSSRAVNALRGAVAAGASAAGYAAADRGTLKERAYAAADAATPWKNPGAFLLGGGVGALAPSAGRVSKQPISQDVIDLRAKGVQLTPGQARGGLAKAAEDAATSLPILGTEIQNARGAGLESFNHAVANDALDPVGLKVPSDVPAGRPTVAYVEKTLGDLYEKTVPAGGMAVDPDLKAAVVKRLGEITQDMTPEARQRLSGILQNRVLSRLGDVGTDAGQAVQGMDGKTFQRVQSELGTVKSRFTGSQDVDQRSIADALNVVREEMRNAAARQNPEFAQQKAAIDQGYARFKRMQGAAASPGAEGGVFTPAQYGGAVRRGDKSVDKGATARGSALGQDLADSARAVLPSKLPDSGTATRGMIATIASAPGAIIAGGATGGPLGAAGAAAGYAATLGGLKAVSKLYGPEAVKAANAALDARISRQQQQTALKELEQMSMKNPRVAHLYQQVAGRLARSAGIASVQQRTALAPANP